MKKYLRYGALCAMILALASCEIRFELDNVTEAKMYVEYLPSPDSPYMEIAFAEPAFKSVSKDPYEFRDSDLNVTVNGKQADISYIDLDTAVELGLAYHGGNTRYARAILGEGFKPGDNIELRLEGRGVKPAHAYTSIPQRPEIKEVTMTPVEVDSSEAIKVVMRLAANVSDNEYYGLKAAIRTTTISAHSPYLYTDDGEEEGEQPMSTAALIPGLPVDVEIDTLVTVYYSIAGQLASTADLNSLDLDAFANVQYVNGMIGTGIFSSEPMMLLPGKMFKDGTYSFYINSLDTTVWTPSLIFTPNDDIPYELPVTIPGEGDGDDEPLEDVPFYMVLSQKNELQLELFRLTDALYNYCKARYLESFNMLSNFGVTPPNFTYTNVYDGLGIVGGLCGVVTPWYPIPEPAAAGN